MAKDVAPFLTKYQTDIPMLPFMSTDLVKVITDLAARFVKPDILVKMKMPNKLLVLSPDDRSNHVDTSAIDRLCRRSPAS